jgi:hypothetical protein
MYNLIFKHQFFFISLVYLQLSVDGVDSLFITQHVIRYCAISCGDPSPISWPFPPTLQMFAEMPVYRVTWAWGSTLFDIMPPLRLGRASKACDLCRKNKTRCYAKDGVGNTCLRCHTLSLSCSLEHLLDQESSRSPSGQQRRHDDSPRHSGASQHLSTDLRYASEFHIIQLKMNRPTVKD